MNNFILNGLSIEQLENLIEQKMRGVIKDIIKVEKKAPERENLITRKQAAKILGISLVTLHKWSIEGLIPSYRISSRIRYKSQEIEDALSKVKSLKYKHSVKE